MNAGIPCWGNESIGDGLLVSDRAHIRMREVQRSVAVSLPQVREQTDDPLVLRAQEGDRVAFDELVRRHADRLYSLVAGLIGPGHEAEEVVQETFLRAWKSISRFRGQSQFYTWLYRIGVNEANRRGAQITARRSRSAFSIDDESGREIASEDADPSRSAQIAELRRGLAEAVSGLPPDQRQAIVLRDMNGLSTAEASEIMGVGEAAFKSRLHRARLRVRSAVSGLVEGEI